MRRGDQTESEVNAIPDELCTAAPTLLACLLGANTTERSEKTFRVWPEGKLAIVTAQIRWTRPQCSDGKSSVVPIVPQHVASPLPSLVVVALKGHSRENQCEL